jgi:N-acetylglucosamine-6-phosphate deacetylase
MQKQYAVSKIFTGEEWLNDRFVVVENGVVEKIISQPASMPVDKAFKELLLVPPFIDVQVYGAAGKLLAAFPNAETLRIMNEVFYSQGTVLFLPTVATNTLEVFKKSIDAVRAYWKSGGEGVHGLHLEGPWINEEKKGAHVKEWIHQPSVEEVKELLDYGKGVIK